MNPFHAIALAQASLPYAPLPAEVPAAVTMQAAFGCDAPAGHFCAFTLFRADHTRTSFGLRGGERAAIQASPGLDRYIVVIDQQAVRDSGACPALLASGRFCKAAPVGSGYNN